MLQEVFYWLFNMSITAAVTGGLVLLVRGIKKLPRRLAVLLWAVPFLRMVIPFGLNSPYSLMTLLSRITTKTVVVYQPFNKLTVSMMNSVTAADTYFPITYRVSILENVFEIAAVIWAIIFLALLLTLAVLYVSTLHEMKDATHLQDNVYLSHKVLSPAVYGIFKPKIILPASYQGQELTLVLLHEKMHIRRGDNFWRMLGFAVAALHWFNPLSWLFLKLFLADLELACDECVLAKLGSGHAKEYAMTLLKSKETAAVFASAFGGAKIRTRIENILSFRKMTWFSLTAALVLIGLVFYVLLTNAG